MATEWKRTRLILWANLVLVAVAAFVLLSATLDQLFVSNPMSGALMISGVTVFIFLTATSVVAASKLSDEVERITERLNQQIALGVPVFSFPTDQRGATGRLSHSPVQCGCTG